MIVIIALKIRISPNKLIVHCVSIVLKLLEDPMMLTCQHFCCFFALFFDKYLALMHYLRPKIFYKIEAALLNFVELALDHGLEVILELRVRYHLLA